MEAGLAFKKGTSVATGVFLAFAVLPHSFGRSRLSDFSPFLLPLCISLTLFCSLQSLSSTFPLCLASLLPPCSSSPLSFPLHLFIL